MISIFHLVPSNSTGAEGVLAAPEEAQLIETSGPIPNITTRTDVRKDDCIQSDYTDRLRPVKGRQGFRDFTGGRGPRSSKDNDEGLVVVLGAEVGDEIFAAQVA